VKKYEKKNNYDDNDASNTFDCKYLQCSTIFKSCKKECLRNLDLTIYYTTDEPGNDSITILIHPLAKEGMDDLDILNPGSGPNLDFDVWLYNGVEKLSRDARPPKGFIVFKAQSFNMGFDNMNVEMTWDLEITQQLPDKIGLLLYSDGRLIDMKEQNYHTFVWRYIPGNVHTS